MINLAYCGVFLFRRTMKEIKEAISRVKSIVITTHKSPDGDAIGSSLALWHYLKSIGKSAVVVVPDAFPEFLNWMEGTESILNYEQDALLVEEKVQQADLIFSLDYNALNRIGALGDIIAKKECLKVVVDHHQDPQDFADYYFVDTDCCSTAQLIYELIDSFEDSEKINSAIGECIYCGIMTDTGSFRFPSTTAKTHRIIANLIDIGVNGSKVHQNVYDNNTEDRLRLLGFSLTEKLKVFKEECAAFISLSKEELLKFNFKKGDTEGLVNYCLSIKGIKMAVLITEKDEAINFSFRSKDGFYVNKIANQYFNGGGHFYAAGGRLSISLNEAETKVEEIIKQYADDLKS